MRRGQMLALVQAGGKGSRMDVLTRERAKPALPYGGSNRLIDLTMSALLHAEIDDVWVSVQHQISSLDAYLAGGRPWDLDRNRGGYRRMVPQTGTGTPTEDGFSHGNADLLLRLSADLAQAAPEHLLVTSADHVFNADLRPVIEEHAQSGRTATILTAEVTRREASDNVVVLSDADGTVRAVDEKPAKPSSGTVATEIFIYRVDPLLEALGELRNRFARDRDPADRSTDSGLGDFGQHLLPHLIASGSVRAVPLAGYWKDLGQPATYLQGHRDLLRGKVDVYDHPGRPVIGNPADRPAAQIRDGATVADSMISPGCIVAGEVRGSVLGPGTVVERGAVVEDSVIFENCTIRRGAQVHTAIVDDGCELGRRAAVGAVPRSRLARDADLVLIGRDCLVNGEVAPGSRLEPGSTA